MPNWILTGIAAGFAAAAMQGVAMSLSLFTIVIFYLSPLPLFLAGFARGWLCALLGAAVMAVVLAVLTGSIPFSIMALVSAGLAPVIASGLSMISRTAKEIGGENASQDTGEGEVRARDREWYPEGRLVLWLAAIAASVTGLSILLMGADFAAYKEFLTSFINPMVAAIEKAMPPNQPPFPKKDFLEMMVVALPVAASSVWLLATVTSMRLAIVMLARTNRALRPWAKFERLAFPANSVIAVLGALIAAFFLSGMPKLLALCAVGAFVTAFTLLGLAIIHHMLANSASKPIILGLLYASLVMFGWILAIPLTVLGLVDLNLNFRKSKPNQT